MRHMKLALPIALAITIAPVLAADTFEIDTKKIEGQFYDYE